MWVCHGVVCVVLFVELDAYLCVGCRDLCAVELYLWGIGICVYAYVCSLCIDF